MWALTVKYFPRTLPRILEADVLRGNEHGCGDGVCANDASEDGGLTGICVGVERVRWIS